MPKAYAIAPAPPPPTTPQAKYSPSPQGEVQPVPAEQSWQPGDSIVEPQGVYQLPNGELVLSHNCQNSPR
ncbi:MAG: hypothetical protein ACFB4J_02330 [Elainellaceae cyanobacterium]